MNYRIVILSLLFSCSLFFFQCSKQKKILPIINQVDTEFQFVNQDSQIVDQNTIKGKIYVVDFFFTSCPTICPKMKAEMIKVHEVFKEREDFILLSHTIDTRNDSVSVLKDFASRLDVQSKDWNFVTGNKEAIFEMAKQYMVSAEVDEKEPGGYIHSGAFVLLDQQSRIRGYYDGTDPIAVSGLIEDIKLLIND